MKARELIGQGIPAGHEIVMQGCDQGEVGPTGTVGVVFIGKRGGVNVIMANGPKALETVRVAQNTEFTFQRVIAFDN